MTERIEFQGSWYLPENPENKIDGSLLFDPNSRSTLELTGSFHDFSIETEDHEIILGFTVNGKEITLFNCISNGFSMHFPGIQVTRYDVQFIFEGYLFAKSEDLKFSKLFANLPKLEEWVNIWGLNIKYNIETSELNADFKIPDSIPFNINNDINGSFVFTYAAGLAPVPDYHIQQNTYLELNYSHEIFFQDFLRYLYQFRTFLTLGILEEIYYESIELINIDEEKSIRIKLYFSQPKRNIKVIERDFHDFLFSYNNINKNFESIIQKWFLLQNTISPVLSIISSSISDRSEYLETKFLSIVQALEIYHRRTTENTQELKAEFQSSFDLISKGLTNTHKKWLINKLAYKWEPSLRSRLKYLFKRYNIPPLSKIIKGKSELNYLIDVTVCSRNYYTHYDESIKRNVLHGGSLYKLIEKLRILLLIIILSETGFSSDEIEELFSKQGYLYKHMLDE